ncbi:3-hydroxyacyl-CoA dehydrogenase family protein [Kitasatospora sp. NPDC094015]|uniref:3-hydroxyacyl-CoA dehydrogenase family protein n=1 Tax=Kitasatospora sp. NPDC094015 TaxID=3155205 RepID=UPI00331D6B1C
MTTTPGPADRLVVLGAGVMGTGISALALGHGVSVALIDTDPEQLVRAEQGIAEQLRLAELMGRLPAGAGATGPGTPSTGTLSTGGGLEPVDGATAVIEAVTEDAGLKAALLAEVSGRVRPGTLLVSNTSSIPVDELADSVARPADLLGTHFMNPPSLIRTVEVVRGARTGDAAMVTVQALLAALGRTPVVVRDSPGFVTSRVLHPMINTAARVVQDGTASVEAVDALMQGCLGHPTGPLRTADLIGIDNLVDSLWVLHERTGDESCRPCDLLLSKVRAGALGRKSGAGFYTYQEDNR